MFHNADAGAPGYCTDGGTVFCKYSSPIGERDAGHKIFPLHDGWRTGAAGTRTIAKCAREEWISCFLTAGYGFTAAAMIIDVFAVSGNQQFGGIVPETAFTYCTLYNKMFVSHLIFFIPARLTGAACISRILPRVSCPG
jgi:hypothetical protein